jgi:signal peptidase II
MKLLKIRHVVLIIAIIIIADQALKIWIKTNYEFGQSTKVFGMSWFQLHFIENSGMAWGLKFWGETGKLILTLFRLAAVIFGVWYLRKIVREKYSRGFIICASLIFAGALGNLIDSMFYGMIFDKGYLYDAAAQKYVEYEGIARLSSNGYASFLHGSVVDMFYFPIIKTKNFVFFNAIFNIADASISIGVITLLLFQRRFFKKHKTDINLAGSETGTDISDKAQVL